MHQCTLAQKLTHNLCRWVMWVVFSVAFRGRCFGREHYPRHGGGLICSNHQSHLDPILVGMSAPRRLSYFARKTLFRFRLFARFIDWWDAIPVDREGLGLSGIKESLKRLKRGEWLVMFPEGTRTRNGEVSTMKRGFATLARRGKVPIIPIGIDGAYDAWPRSQMLPSTGEIHIHVGQPISWESIQTMTDEELAREVESRIRECHQLARQGRSTTRSRTQSRRQCTA